MAAAAKKAGEIIAVGPDGSPIRGDSPSGKKRSGKKGSGSKKQRAAQLNLLNAALGLAAGTAGHNQSVHTDQSGHNN